MPTEFMEIEGTWEEIVARQSEFSGKRLRIRILADELDPRPYHPARGSSTGADLLKHAGSWIGDDLKECLHEVVRNRTPARF